MLTKLKLSVGCAHHLVVASLFADIDIVMIGSPGISQSVPSPSHIGKARVDGKLPDMEFK